MIRLASTRTPRWRAGTRANKRHRTVPTFASDKRNARKASTGVPAKPAPERVP